MADAHDPLPTLEDLQRKIDKAKGPPEAHTEAAANGDMSLVMRYSVELLAGVGVGCMVGYVLDRWFGTMPLFLIICLFLGMAGGMLNVIRSGRLADQKAEAKEAQANHRESDV